MMDHRQISQAIQEQSGALAEATTVRQYERQPELTTRYGVRGRAKCVQDARHHFLELGATIGLSSPPVFARYIAWARDLLLARGIPQTDLVVHLECMQQAVQQILPENMQATVNRYIQTGLEQLDANHSPGSEDRLQRSLP
jgi:hypothetical protein